MCGWGRRGAWGQLTAALRRVAPRCIDRAYLTRNLEFNPVVRSFRFTDVSRMLIVIGPGYNLHVSFQRGVRHHIQRVLDIYYQLVPAHTSYLARVS